MDENVKYLEKFAKELTELLKKFNLVLMSDDSGIYLRNPLDDETGKPYHINKTTFGYYLELIL